MSTEGKGLFDLSFVQQDSDSESELDNEPLLELVDDLEDEKWDPDEMDSEDFLYSWVSSENVSAGGPMQPMLQLKFTECPGSRAITVAWKPVDYFLAYFPPSMFTRIAEETNRYASQFVASNPKLPMFSRFQKYAPTNAEEVMVFVALEMSMGMCVKSDVSEYWITSGLNVTPVYKKIMSRDRFTCLRSMLHFNDNSMCPEPGSADYDPMYKVRPLSDAMKEQCLQNYVPHANLCVGRWKTSQKLQVPSGTNNSEVKIWCLCDSTNGMCLNWKIHCGEKPSSNGLGMDVLTELSAPYFNTSRVIYHDKFFTSATLALYLSRKGIGSCGPVTLKRDDIPKELQKSPGKAESRSVLFHKDEPTGLVMSCSGGSLSDRRRVNFLSTVHGNEVVHKRVTCKKSPKGYQDIQKPKIEADVNQFMVGVNIMRTFTTKYFYKSKSRKTYLIIYDFLKEVAMYNGYILHKETTKKAKSYRSFRDDVVQGLIEMYRNTDQPFPRVHSYDSTFVPERLSGRHFVEQMHEWKTPRDCVVCSDRKGRQRHQTSLGCPDCGVALCVGKCFKRYHTCFDYKLQS
ncbi:piggyBac transposable element-derived protein 4-like [Haliotis rubra]|uniref:piggyBac transposable element-derived protein 4-like n=1 Tax=Haliotis rubra TaxID=36100 RepID=UPI001EE60C7B|nr:piggyBac transposable element-derived protein 4-like [Haliotis rubra]